MSVASRHELVDLALAVTRQMAALGDAGDWEQVVALEIERRGLLEAAFTTRAQVDEDLAAKVRQLLAIDQELLASARQAQGQLADALTHSNRGRAAATAYRATGA
jgi:hypothetical protein